MPEIATLRASSSLANCATASHRPAAAAAWISGQMGPALRAPPTRPCGAEQVLVFGNDRHAHVGVEDHTDGTDLGDPRERLPARHRQLGYRIDPILISSRTKTVLGDDVEVRDDAVSAGRDGGFWGRASDQASRIPLGHGKRIARGEREAQLIMKVQERVDLLRTRSTPHPLRGQVHVRPPLRLVDAGQSRRLCPHSSSWAGPPRAVLRRPSDTQRRSRSRRSAPSIA
jgi:hypothetical protein